MHNRNAVKEQLAIAGREMLQIMAATEGAITLQPSNVVVHVLESAKDHENNNGVRATRSSAVKMHYHGTLADGTIFDSTLGGEPMVVPLATIVPGWREGILSLHEGETAMIGVPPEVGYGPLGTSDGSVPGDATLFWKVQLLQVLTAGIGGLPSLLGPDGKRILSNTMKNSASIATTGVPTTSTTATTSSSGLLGVDGRPL
jgi:FKBP-type peptidyl-prolyl cis-trans isomerase